jgi:hypothetical protein
VAVYLIVTFVVNQRLSELQLETRLLISEQETLLATIAETTARNGGDEVTERIIKDCPFTERVRFDELLSKLNQGLTLVELTELERLFGRCGSFFAERKSVMVSRLQREVQIYETFVNQLNNLTESDNNKTYKVGEWQRLAELETKQSQLFSELVQAQDEIISQLLAGNSPDSEAVQTTIQNANKIQETLIVTNTQASTVRSNLVSL